MKNNNKGMNTQPQKFNYERDKEISALRDEQLEELREMGIYPRE